MDIHMHDRARLSLYAIACGVVLCVSASAQDAVGERVESVLRLRADTDHGREIYGRDCSSCHGRTGWGDAATGNPALAGQRPNYLVKQLADVIETDRTLPEMHRLMARWQFEDPQTLRDVATFLADLPPNPSPQQGTGRQLAEGRRVYEAECAACHGRFGEGDNAAYVPALRGQHFVYLQAQMQSLATGHRSGMDGEGQERLRALSLAQLDAVADHLSRLPSERDAVPDGNPFVPGAE